MQLIGAEEQRLLADLREAGYEVETVWRWMFEPPHHYLGAGEILVGHLGSATDKGLIDCLAKLLSHREFAFAVPTLIAKLEEVDRLTSKHVLAWFWDRTSPLERSGIGLYGGVEIALGALLLRRSPLALAAYVAFVAVSIVCLVGIQRAQQLVSMPLFLLVAVVCLAVVVYFGTLLFPRSS